MFKVFLFLHIIGGSIGLLSGSINLLRRKGDMIHKRIGKVFTYSMLITGFSAFALSVIHPSYFLFMVGVFTVYLVGTGNRYIYLKMLGSTQRPKLVDWALTISMMISGLAFIALGINYLMAGNSFGIVFIVFGSLGLFFVKTDITNYRGKIKEKNYWLLTHLQRMTGGYIAAVTAFLVVNAKHSPVVLPSFIFWLLPTIILTPLIIIWSNRLRIK